MTGLQVWAQTELRRQGVQNISQVIVATNCLVDYQMQQEGKGKEGKQMHDIGLKDARPFGEKGLVAEASSKKAMSINGEMQEKKQGILLLHLQRPSLEEGLQLE